MPDMDLVVKGLELCRECGYLGGNDCKGHRKDCPYGRLEALCVAMLLSDVNTTLKEQNKKGTWRDYEGMLTCSVCGAEFYKEIMEYCGDKVPHFCPDCGTEMVGV